MQQTGIGSNKAHYNRCTHSVFSGSWKQFPQPFLFGEKGAPLNRKQFQALLKTIKGMLRGRGIGRAHRVALVVPNGPEMATAFLSVSAVAVCAPLNPAYQAPEFEFYLRDLAARAVIVDADLSSPVRKEAASLGIPVLELHKSDAVAGVFQLEGPQSDRVNQDSWSGPEDIAMILHTSGTTSRPKMVPLSHRNIWASARNVAETLQLSPDDRCLNVMPLFHIHGLIAALAASSIAGASVVCTPGFQENRFLDWLRIFNPTWYTAVPTIHQAILQLSEKNQEEVRNAGLRFIRSSSASLPPTVMQQLESFFDAPMVEAYGMTEAAHQMCCNPLPTGIRKAGTVGPSAGPDVAIMDEEGNLLSPQSKGEVVIRGENVMAGYESNPEANEAAFQDGWFRTGDQGFLDEDGYLTLTGRLKEIINRGGENIAPREIDEILLTHPAVAQAVTFAIPHPAYGETVAAAVVLKEGVLASEAELRHFAASRLAEFKVPQRIVMVDAVPKGPTGKLQRIGLYEKLKAELEVDYVPPSTPIHKILVSIFATVLERSGIGIHDHFFDLGGDSLGAGRVITRIERELEVAIPISVFFLAPTVAELAEEVAHRRTAVNVELEKILDELECLPDEEARPAPLSFQQERFWVLEQWAPGSTRTATSHAAYHLSGVLSSAKLNQAWQSLIVRHESLRTVIQTIDGEPVQTPLVPSELEQKITEVDVTGMNLEQVLSRLKTDTQRLTFHENRPGVQPFLYRISPEEHVLLFAMRHIFTDGWTKMILLKDLLSFYHGALTGETMPLAELPVRYRDYARWQRNQADEKKGNSHILFWKDYLKDVPPLELPLDRKRPSRQEHDGAAHFLPLDAKLEEMVHQAARSWNATDFMVWMAAFQLLLFRYSSQEVLAVGTPVSGRTALETESMAGLFMNPLALKADLSGRPTFVELVNRVKTGFLSAMAHQDVPFHQVVEAVHPPRDPSRTPIFQVLFHQRKFPPVFSPVLDLEADLLVFDPGTSEFDLSLELVRRNGKLAAWFQYDTALFRQNSITRMALHYKNIVQNAIENPGLPISEIPLMDTAERKQLAICHEGRETSPDSRTLNRIISDVATQFPDKVALEKEGRTVSYRQLEEASSRIAGAICADTEENAEAIGISMTPSLSLFTAIVGILKAGCAYVPIDPELPERRKQFIAADAGISLLISDDPERDTCWYPNEPLLTVSALLKGAIPIKPESTCNDPESLAYIMYTSGSTGRPKGVMVTHRNVVNFSQAMITRSFHGHESRVLQFASISFDMNVDEFFPTLLSASTLVLKSREMNSSMASFLDSCRKQRITYLALPTSFFHELAVGLAGGLAMPACVQSVLFGGDRADSKLVRVCQNILNGKVALWNHYGPTETTVCALYDDLSSPESLPEWMDEVPIGKPTPGYRVAILDKGLRPVPFGVPGELVISGASVSRGYRNLPQETAERFLPDPSCPGACMYRTGDMGRILEDGRVQFLGRMDNQVKIRGFRVEPGEIESTLGRHPDVTEVVVTAPLGSDGNRHLVAWIVPAKDKRIDPDNLKQLLLKQLPVYMIPAQFQSLDAIPRTRSGKPDRQKLTATLPDIHQNACGLAVATETEKKIAEIWKRILNLAALPYADDNFFDRGGHSLAAVRMLGAVEQQWKQRISMEQLFRNPTVGNLARLLDENGPKPEVEGILEIRATGDSPPLFLIPPAGSTFFRFQLLAEHLSESHPMFALQPAGLSGETGPLNSMEEIVARYAKIVHSRAGNQPFWIGGSCFGAIVAMELHHALAEMGTPPMGAILLDPALNTLPDEAASKQPFYRRLSKIGSFITSRFKRFRFRFIMRLTRERRQILNVWQASIQARKSCHHRPFAGDTFVLLSEKKRYHDPVQRRRWSKLGATDNCFYRIPGTAHGDLLSPSHVQEVADTLNEIMESESP